MKLYKRNQNGYFVYDTEDKTYRAIEMEDFPGIKDRIPLSDVVVPLIYDFLKELTQLRTGLGLFENFGDSWFFIDKKDSEELRLINAKLLE